VGQVLAKFSLGGATRGQGDVATGLDKRLSRIWKRLRTQRRLRFTREGKIFVGITLGVGFAAINTGNNLLYLLLGMLLALIVVSGIMSELSLRKLTVVRRLPARAQVGKPHVVEIEVFNHKKRIPSYAIEVEDLREALPADKRCFFLKISPTSAQVAAYRRTPSRRGRDRHTGFRIGTRFPFGLFEKSKETTIEGDLLIYPGIDPVELPPAVAGPSQGQESSLGRGRGEDYLGLRAMRDGEDPRDVHWRKSAAMSQLVLRERARESRPDVVLHIEVRRPAAATSDWDTQFEKRIREVASRTVAHVRRGDSVAVRTSTGELVRADKLIGADPVLRYLALLQPTRETAAPRSIQASSQPHTTPGAVAAKTQVAEKRRGAVTR
jgi:uncharacterized protein (DUF58 family)